MNYEVAYFGAVGSYTHIVARKIFEDVLDWRVKFKELISLDKTFDFVQQGKVNRFSVIPIENSNGGIVRQPVDMLSSCNVKILAEYSLDIRHTLLVNKGAKLNDLKQAYAHPQSLLQVRNFLVQNEIKDVPYMDNSSAAKYVKDSQDISKCAIGSEELASVYDLEILKKNLIDKPNVNITRFLILGDCRYNKEKIEKFYGTNSKYKTSMFFWIKNTPGMLYKCLGGFATNNINLLRIESRPLSGSAFDYYFFVDFEGHLMDDNIKRALDELSFFTQKIKILGSYKSLN